MRKGHDQQLVDVICQHNKDGSMIPMRVRLTDEDGAVQTYTIKNYEDLSHQGTRTMPDGMYVTDRTFVYECQVQAFGRYRMIRLYYEPSGTVWKMTVCGGNSPFLRNIRHGGQDNEEENLRRFPYKYEQTNC